jgi:predicted GH43/DUF377 family glycosyl hydrolase
MEKHLIIKTEDIAPTSPELRVLGVFNPATIKVGSTTIMIARVAETMKESDSVYVYVPIWRHKKFQFIQIAMSDPNSDFSDARVIHNHEESYLTSISHFRIGRSEDGHHFVFDEQPLFPESVYEEYGIEDPRITYINGRYYITYTAVSSFGINVGLMVTDDFKKFDRLGNIFPFDNKDCVIFPQLINNHYYAYHRPSTSDFGKLDIWLAKSTNLLHWGEHEALKQARIEYQCSARVGAGAVPFLTKEGWVIIYHSADKDHRYHLCALLVDKDDPSKVLKKSKQPLIEPTEQYEKEGFVPNVIFTCGVTNDDNMVHIYYGVCDQNIAVCHMTYDDLFKNMENVS